MSISLCELDEIEERQKFCFVTGGKFHVTDKVIKPWIETGPSIIASSNNNKEIKVKKYAHVLCTLLLLLTILSFNYFLSNKWAYLPQKKC